MLTLLGHSKAAGLLSCHLNSPSMTALEFQRMAPVYLIDWHLGEDHEAAVLWL